MKRLILSGATIVAASAFSLSAWADVVCRGQVVDEQGEPLIGAIVTVPGTKIGTNTDIDGYFKLSVPDHVKNLKITYVGYKAIDLSPRGQMGEIRMDPDTKMLQDVVVTQSMARTRQTPGLFHRSRPPKSRQNSEIRNFPKFSRPLRAYGPPPTAEDSATPRSTCADSSQKMWPCLSTVSPSTTWNGAASIGATGQDSAM